MVLCQPQHSKWIKRAANGHVNLVQSPAAVCHWH